MQPLTAATANPPEDIEAVLGRFQAWSASRTADKTPQKTAPRKSADLPDGVRELSYEEALESSRYRWQTHSLPTESGVSAQTAAEQEPLTPVSQTTPSEAMIDDQAILPDKVTFSAATAPPARAVAPAFNAVLADALPAEPDPAALALIWPAAPKNERQVSMSLRVAASEHALIKARATEAGLSVSAYLRHCALEVEQLRAQVHHTLALMEQGSEHRPVRSLPADPPPKGFLARLSRRIFGTPARPTLRALPTAGSPRPPAHAG
jgi:hypothetical protein